MWEIDMVLDRRIRMIVVDDHPVVRDGIGELLNHFSDFHVVGKAGDGAEAVRLAAELGPEVIIMEVLMPERDGIDACREIMDLLPGTRVLMLTASTAPQAVVESVAAGAAGFLLKDSGVEELAGAVREVAEGRFNLTAEVLRQAAAMIRRDLGVSGSRGPEVLTERERERELLRLFCSGRSYAQIADADGIGRSTVRNVLHRVQDKVGTESKQEMVVWAVTNGLIDPAEPKA